MHMFWRKSRPSPSSSDQARLQKQLLGVFDRATEFEVYTLEQLAERLRAKKIDALVQVLAELSKKQKVDQVFRVESPKNRGQIDDFRSLDEVPDVIFDWRQDRDVEVEPNMVRVLFRKHQSGTDRSEDREALRKIG